MANNNDYEINLRHNGFDWRAGASSSLAQQLLFSGTLTFSTAISVLLGEFFGQHSDETIHWGKSAMVSF